MRGRAKPQQYVARFQIDKYPLDTKSAPKHAQLCCSCGASHATGATVPFLHAARLPHLTGLGYMPKTECFKFLRLPSLSFTSLVLLNCNQFEERTADMPFFPGSNYWI